MEKDYQIQVLKEMEDHPGWKLYQAHLERLWTRKEQVKSSHLRSPLEDRTQQARYEQGVIDGLHLAVNELSKAIQTLTSPEEEETEVNPKGERFYGRT